MSITIDLLHSVRKQRVVAARVGRVGRLARVERVARAGRPVITATGARA